MNPRLYDQPVDSGQQFPRLTILAGDDLFHIFQSVLGIAGVDSLGRVADLEVDAGFQSRFTRQNGKTHLFSAARINSRFVDHDSVLSKVLAN